MSSNNPSYPPTWGSGRRASESDAHSITPPHVNPNHNTSTEDNQTREGEHYQQNQGGASTGGMQGVLDSLGRLVLGSSGGGQAEHNAAIGPPVLQRARSSNELVGGPNPRTGTTPPAPGVTPPIPSNLSIDDVDEKRMRYIVDKMVGRDPSASYPDTRRPLREDEDDITRTGSAKPQASNSYPFSNSRQPVDSAPSSGRQAQGLFLPEGLLPSPPNDSRPGSQAGLTDLAVAQAQAIAKLYSPAARANAVDAPLHPGMGTHLAPQTQRQGQPNLLPTRESPPFPLNLHAENPYQNSSGSTSPIPSPYDYMAHHPYAMQYANAGMYNPNQGMQGQGSAGSVGRSQASLMGFSPAASPAMSPTMGVAMGPGVWLPPTEDDSPGADSVPTMSPGAPPPSWAGWANQQPAGNYGWGGPGGRGGMQGTHMPTHQHPHQQGGGYGQSPQMPSGNGYVGGMGGMPGLGYMAMQEYEYGQNQGYGQGSMQGYSGQRQQQSPFGPSPPYGGYPVRPQWMHETPSSTYTSPQVAYTPHFDPYREQAGLPRGRGRGRGSSFSGRGGAGPQRHARWSTSGPAEPLSPGMRSSHSRSKSIGSIAEGHEKTLGMGAATGLGIVDSMASAMALKEELDAQNVAIARKAYHPSAPANRSEFVMWVGNVPTNATHEEMWKFLSQPIRPEDVPEGIAFKPSLTVSSVFLISRSSCAFVNLATQDDLILAVTLFNGKSLRPHDARCPKLVCRVRKKDDDLKSGVGGQRGVGLHVQYVKDNRAQDKAEADNNRAADEGMPLSPAVLEHPPEGEGRRRESVIDAIGGITPAAFAAWQHDRTASAGTHSFASTNSSFLTRHFPKRYFILKSLTPEELDVSVRNGNWSTQLHNEAFLDQAYRTSSEVYLIFGANKQGGFFGYGIMRSGIGSQTQTRAGRSVSWGSRQDATYSSSGSNSKSSGSRSSLGKAAMISPSQPDIPEDEGEERTTTLSGRPRIPHANSSGLKMTTSSPGEMTPGMEDPHAMASMGFTNATAPVPGVMSLVPPELRAQTLDPVALARIREESTFSMLEPAEGSFQLDKDAPARFVQSRQASQEEGDGETGEGGEKKTTDHTPDDTGVVRHDMMDEEPKPSAEQVASARRKEGGEVFEASGPSAEITGRIGNSFKVEWLKIGDLPFSKLRHLRNPWNQDKEVKVSRDGTELEPSVGALLISEWENLEDVSKIQSKTGPAARNTRAGQEIPAY